VTGDLLDEAAYALHLEKVLPSQEDRKRIREIMKEPGSIAA
jgi:hypothetical protein